MARLDLARSRLERKPHTSPASPGASRLPPSWVALNKITRLGILAESTGQDAPTLPTSELSPCLAS